MSKRIISLLLAVMMAATLFISLAQCAVIPWAARTSSAV